ncbi:hypothetical protein [Bacillus sp. FJAT-52991]|uniref:Phage gp6-like head-tail connector protein n=1 Tax=Bacillus kandeliae TaxID=3129297 RepID=A0ABZ2N2T9_9BACI
MLASNALTTVEEAKRFLGLTDEAGVERAINEASAMIETYCRRFFAVGEHTQYISQGDFTLDHYPVIEMLSLNGDEFPKRIRVDKVSGIIDGEISGNVVYKAGYVLPEDETPDTPRTLPYDIERACLQLIDSLFVDEDGFISDAAALKIGDWSLNTKGANSGGMMPEDVRTTLDMYRRVLV